MLRKELSSVGVIASDSWFQSVKVDSGLWIRICVRRLEGTPSINDITTMLSLFRSVLAWREESYVTCITYHLLYFGATPIFQGEKQGYFW